MSNNTEQDIIDVVEKSITDITKNITYGDKTIDQWQEYFTIKIEDANSSLYLRKKLTEVGNKLDECVSILIHIKMSIKSLELQEYKETYRIINENTVIKSASGKEKLAKQATYKISSAKRLNELLLIPWEEMKYNLARKAKDIEAQLWSIASDLKNASRTNAIEEHF